MISRYRTILLRFVLCSLLWSSLGSGPNLRAADPEPVIIQGVVMLRLPAGSFVMGTSDSEKEILTGLKEWTKMQECERPAHLVTISKPFLMGKFEITQKQWRAVTGKNPSAFKGDTLPVESVSWDEVQSFIKELNKKADGKFRLPTEAEWEYSCRAGSTNLFGLSEDSTAITAETLAAHAWFHDNSDGKTHAVGGKTPNAWGLCDLNGNVWEWCQDWFEFDYYAKSPAKDPLNAKADSTERVFRGGSWFLGKYNQRAAFRGGNVPSFKSQYVGFRLAHDP